jgi:hypothetical protein
MQKVEPQKVKPQKVEQAGQAPDIGRVPHLRAVAVCEGVLTRSPRAYLTG